MVKNSEQITLLVDAGNSAVKWALLESDGLAEMASSLYPEVISSGFFIEQWQELKPVQVVISCVASNATWKAMQNASRELWNIEAVKLSAEKQAHGLTNAYENVENMGSDRWYAMVAARQLAEGAFMVVSAGSAITLDVVDDSGLHQGGYIIPGLSMMRESLGKDTANIEITTGSMKNQQASLSLGNSTTACVEAGIHMAAVSLIEAVYEKEKVNTEKLHCYLSGGNAKVLAGLLSLEAQVISNLVLRGLAKNVAE